MAVKWSKYFNPTDFWFVDRQDIRLSTQKNFSSESHISQILSQFLICFCNFLTKHSIDEMFAFLGSLETLEFT